MCVVDENAAQETKIMNYHSAPRPAGFFMENSAGDCRKHRVAILIALSKPKTRMAFDAENPHQISRKNRVVRIES